MAYWVSRIVLANGKLVAENTLSPTVNAFDGPTPKIGDEIPVTCRGRDFLARVISVKSRSYTVAHIRVQEISENQPQPMRRFYGYYIKRILLRNGEFVPDKKLRKMPYHKPTPEIGDEVMVTVLGQQLTARVTGVEYAAEGDKDKKDSIHIEEI